ncbi:bromodomain-containing protein 4-like isoform X2 [Branchiostoma floridae]|uniref:Bromodomain-containing protein 4-like isoform X2 n=1 Tax=Branchiostoma floridae TaxID=7739 RepID=A0A9J7KZK2_BRAFL|nr:bromodomain-containing protein 4-like isoform X2 [Branchiostoma floridae]
MQNYPGLRWPQLPPARWRPDFPVPPLPMPPERGVFPFQRPVRMAGAGGGHESSGQPPPGPVIYSVHSGAHIPQEIARDIGVPLQYLGFNHPMLAHNDAPSQPFPTSGVQQPFPPHNPRHPDPRSQAQLTRPTVTSPPVSRIIMPAWQHNKPMPLAGIHPYQWTKADVLTWVRWAVDEFSLTGVDEQRFGMNGKALSLLGKEGFTDRVPFAGDVLYNLLHNLLQGYEHLARNNIPISQPRNAPMCYPTPPSTNPSPQITVSSPGATITRLLDSGDPVPTQPVASQKSETETDKPSEVEKLVTSSCSPTGSSEIVRTASAQLHRLKEQHDKLLPSVLSAPELQVQDEPVGTTGSPTMPELTKIEDSPTSVITTGSQTTLTDSSSGHEAVIQRPMVAPVVPNSARCEEDQKKSTNQDPASVQGHKTDPMSRHPKRRWSVDAVVRETANPINHDQRAAKVIRVGPTVEGVEVQGRMMSPPSLPGEKTPRVGENIFIPCPEIERELAKLRERDARRMKLYDRSINEESLRAERRYMVYAEPGRVIRPFDQVQFQAHLQGGSFVRPPAHTGPVVGEAAVLQQLHGPPLHALPAQQGTTPTSTPASIAQRPVTRSSQNGAQQQASTTDHQEKKESNAQSTQTQETAGVDGLKSAVSDTSKASEPSHTQTRDGNMPPAVPPGHTALGPHLIRGDARLPLLHSTIEQLRARRPPLFPYMRLPLPAQILGPDGKPLHEMVARHRLPVPVFPQYSRQERDRGPEQVPTSGEHPVSVDQPPRPVFPPNSTSDPNLRTLPVPPIYRLAVPTAPPSGPSPGQQVYDLRGVPQDRPVSSRPEDPPSAPVQEHTPAMTDVRVKVERPEGPEEGYGVAPENRQGHDHSTHQQRSPVIIKTEHREEEPSDVTGQDQGEEAVTPNTVEPSAQQAVNEEKPSEEAAQQHILRQMLTRDRKGYCKEFWERVHNSQSSSTTLTTPTNDIKLFQGVTTSQPTSLVPILPMPHPDPRGPPPPPVKRGRGRPRLYWPGYRKKPPPQTNTPPGAPVRECRLLWEFLLRLLANEEKYKHAIKWLDKPRKVFRIVNANAIARLWGKQKNRDNMTYEKLSRAMRYYYRMDILVKEGSQRLTYRFLKGLEDIHADRANRRRNRSGSTSATSRNAPPLTNEPHNKMGVLDLDAEGKVEAKPQHNNLGNMQQETQRLYGTSVENVSSSMQKESEEGSGQQMPSQGASSSVSPGYSQALDVKMFRRSHSMPQEVANVTSVPKMEKDTVPVKIPYRSEDTPAANENNVRNFRPSLDSQYIELNRMLRHQAMPSSVVPSRGYHRTTDNIPKATTAPPIFKKRRFSVDGATPYSTASLDVSNNTNGGTAGSNTTKPYLQPPHRPESADTHVHVRITEAPSPKRTKIHHVFFPPAEHSPGGREPECERDKEDSGEQEEPLDMSVKKT